MTINFDGHGPKDIIEQRYQTLEQIEIEEPKAVEDIWKQIKKLP